MTSSTDHFAEHVEYREHAAPNDSGFAEGTDDASSLEEHYYENEGTENEPKRKLKIPTPVLIIGCMVLCGVLGTAYKAFMAPAEPKTNYQAPQAGQIPVSPSSGGMLAASRPSDIGFDAPATTSVNAIAPASTELDISTGPTTLTASAPSMGLNVPASSSASQTVAPPVAEAIPQKNEEQQNQIDALRAQVQKLAEQVAELRKVDAVRPKKTSRTVIATAPHVPSRARPAPKAATPARVKEELVGYHIKQVVPDQGWVENEATGRQKVVFVGDEIGGARITKIDADNGRIETTAGVIK